MSDRPNIPDSGAAEPELRTSRRSLRSRISIVWVVPILALLVSLFVVWQNYNERGPLIEIVFDDAAGVKVDETQLKYRDVSIGVVEGVNFTEGLDRVVLQVRVDKDIADYVDADAEFWIVKPEVTAQGVTGLDTVLSGVYIEASWNGDIGEPERRFEGRITAPLAPYGREGVSFRLRGQSVDGLSEGTQIYYRGISVGKISNLRLTENGASVIVDAFIRSPESRLITTATRFWDTSGFSFSFGAQGAQLDVSSLASLLSGGISFDSPVSGGEAVDADTEFRLFGDEETARSSVFSDASDGTPVSLSIVFDESVPGLEVGADVDFGGIGVGNVTALTGLVDEGRFGDRDIRLLTTIDIKPGKLGLGGASTDADVYDFFDFAIRSGLRAQLQTASILGGLQIALVQIDEVTDAALDTDAEPYPQIPSIPADLSDFSDTAQGVFNRINNLPIEEILDNANALMASATSLLNNDGVKETPNEVLGILNAVRGLVTSEGVQSIPNQASEFMITLNQTAQDLSAVVGDLQAVGAAEQLTAALQSAEEAADAVTEAMDGVPELMADAEDVVQGVDTLIGSINDMPLVDVAGNLNDLLESIDLLIARAETQAIPGEVNQTLEAARQVMANVIDSGVLEQANQTIASAETAITDVTVQLQQVLTEAQRAAASIANAADDAPEVVNRANNIAADLEALSAQARTLPLEELSQRVTDLVNSANTLVSSDDTQRLPGALADALNEVQRVLITIQDGGLIENANQTMASAQQAAGAIETAADQLPALLNSSSRLLTQTQAVIEGYEANGQLGGQVRSTLRDVQDAAKSIDQLARQLERAPNSLLFGR